MRATVTYQGTTDLTHDPFSRRALSAYAEACHATHPTLASAIRQRLIGTDPGSSAVPHE